MISQLKLLLSDNQDFLFHPIPQANLTLYSHIMNYETSKILVRNIFDLLLCLPRQHKLSHLLDMGYENCFLIDTQAAYNTASVPLSSHFFSNLDTKPMLLPTNALMETVPDNRIRVFKDSNAVRQIADLVAEYSSICESQSFV